MTAELKLRKKCMIILFTLLFIFGVLSSEGHPRTCSTQDSVLKPTLSYFYTAGRGEVSRLILEESEADYEFDSFTNEWPQRKIELGEALWFGQVPLYREPSGFSIPQSGAIERYLARKYGLAGSDHEIAVVDSIAEGVNDLSTHFRAAERYPVESERQAQIQKFVDETIPKWLNYFEKLLDGKTYFVGNRLSYADLKYFCLLQRINQTFEHANVLENFPFSRDLLLRIESRPRIKRYLESDPYSSGEK